MSLNSKQSARICIIITYSGRLFQDLTMRHLYVLFEGWREILVDLHSVVQSALFISWVMMVHLEQSKTVPSVFKIL